MNYIAELRERVAKTGISAYQIALVSGLSYNTVAGALYRGNNVTIDTLARIIKALDEIEAAN